MIDLSDRFPEIGFFLTFTPFEPFELFVNAEGKINAKRQNDYLYSQENISQEVERWHASLDLKEVEVLYIYGLGLGYYFEPLQAWLEEKKERALIFLEEDIAVIDAFLKHPLSETLLKNPQVHLRFIPDAQKWKPFLEELIHFFPSDEIFLTALATYGRRHQRKIGQMRLYLQRGSALMNALLTEALYGHKLFENLYPNFKRIPESFSANAWKGRFQNIPAVICGAGPSLIQAIPALKELEQKALIFAGGSTLTALSAHGITPHLGLALDPNRLEYARLKESTTFENPFIYAPRLFPKVFDLFNGPFGYLRSDTGGPSESWLEEQLKLENEVIGPDLGQEALSVTTIALAYAYALGCNPIIFVGVDLAFTGMKTYAAGVVGDAALALERMKKEKKAIDQLVRKKDRHGKFIYTLVKWVMESATIGSYAKAHPDRQFINCTEGGIGFPGVAYKPFQETIQEHCTSDYDLRAWIHAEMEESRFRTFTVEQIEGLFREVKESLERCTQITDEILSASQEMPLLEMDFREEVAFHSLLQGIEPALARLLRTASSPSRWTHLQTIIQEYLKVLAP